MKEIVFHVLTTYMPILISALGIVVHLVVAHRLRCNKDLASCLKSCLPALAEELKMKYRTIDTREKKSQSFTPYRDDFLLNSSTGELEKLPIPENVQEKIDSYVECALERALERFLPKNVTESDQIVDYTQSVEDLAVLGDAMEVAEAYREELGLPDNYSLAQIYAAVDARAKELKGQLGELGKKKVDKKDEA